MHTEDIVVPTIISTWVVLGLVYAVMVRKKRGSPMSLENWMLCMAMGPPLLIGSLLERIKF